VGMITWFKEGPVNMSIIIESARLLPTHFVDAACRVQAASETLARLSARILLHHRFQQQQRLERSQTHSATSRFLAQPLPAVSQKTPLVYFWKTSVTCFDSGYSASADFRFLVLVALCESDITYIDRRCCTTVREICYPEYLAAC
jgi:hypothetical protein